MATDDSDQTTIDDVIAEYLRSSEAGRYTDRSALLAQHPQWAAELQEFFSSRDALDLLAGSLQSSRAKLLHAARPGTHVKYFGDYELLDEIGYGGMGIVYKARQVSLDRHVALKMILDRSRNLERFRTEAEAAASLDHPNIVPIYEFGEHEGWPYYSMALFEGGDLRAKLADRLAPPESVHLVAKLARAVQYAHDRGVLHRDLKPANVVLDDTGEPHIADFGLAKVIGQESHATKSGAVLGTPSYMAPEQAVGHNDEVTRATDIYGLGAILYSLLTGRAPFEGRTSLSVLRKVEMESPRSLRASTVNVSADLQTICLKCLEKQPHQRYSSAEVLADDLERYLRGEPVLARPVMAYERTWRWCQRNPAMAMLAGVVAALLFAAAIGGSWMAGRERQARLAAELAQHNEEQSRKLVEENLIDAYVNSGRSAERQNNFAEAQLWCATAADLSRPGTRRRHANIVRYLGWQTRVPRCVRAAFFDGGPTRTLAFHPAGRYLVCGDQNGSFACWDLKQGELRRLRGLNTITQAAWSPDGTLLAMGNEHGEFALFSTANGKRALHQEFNGAIGAIAFSAGADQLAVAHGNWIKVWTLESNMMLSAPPVEKECESPVSFLVFNPRGDRLVAQTESTAAVFDLSADSRDPVFEPVPHRSPHRAMVQNEGVSPPRPAFLSDQQLMTIDGSIVISHDTTTGEVSRLTKLGNHLFVALNQQRTSMVSGGNNSYARVFSIRPSDHVMSRKMGYRLDHTEFVTTGQFHPDGNVVATGSWDSRVRLWSVRTGLLVGDLPHQSAVAAIAFSPDGRFISTAQSDGIVRLWRTSRRGQLVYRHALRGAMSSIRTTPDQEHWYPTGSNDPRAEVTTFGVFRFSDGINAGPPIKLGGYLRDAEMSHDGKLVGTITGSTKTTGGECQTKLTVWHWPAGERFSEFALPGSATGVRFHPRGNQLAVQMASGGVLVFQSSGGEVIYELAPKHVRQPVPFRQPGELLYSPDGETLIVWDQQSDVGVYQTSDSQPRYDPLSVDLCTDVEISPDGKFLAVAEKNGQVRVFDLRTGQPAGPLLPHGGYVYQVHFSADAQRLVTACADNRARIIDWRTGELIGMPIRQENDVFDAVFTPDGEALVAIGDNNSLSIYDATDGQHLFSRPWSPAAAEREPFDRRVTIAVNGAGDMVAIAGQRRSIDGFDLRELKIKPDLDTKRLRLEGQLAAGARIKAGSAVPMLTDEWLAQWLSHAQRYPVRLDLEELPDIALPVE